MAQRVKDAMKLLTDSGLCATDDEALEWVRDLYAVVIKNFDRNLKTPNSPVRGDIMEAIELKITERAQAEKASEPVASATEPAAPEEVALSDIDQDLPMAFGPVTREEIEAEKAKILPLIHAAKQDRSQLEELANTIHASAHFLGVPEEKIYEVKDADKNPVCYDDVYSGAVRPAQCWYYRSAFAMMSEEDKTPEEFLKSWGFPGLRLPSSRRPAQSSAQVSASAPPSPDTLRRHTPPQRLDTEDQAEPPDARHLPPRETRAEKRARKRLEKDEQAAHAVNSPDPDVTPDATPLVVETTERGTRRVSSASMRPPAPPTSTTQPPAAAPSETVTTATPTDEWASRWSGPSEEELNRIAADAATASADLSISMDELMGASS